MRNELMQGDIGLTSRVTHPAKEGHIEQRSLISFSIRLNVLRKQICKFPVTGNAREARDLFRRMKTDR